MDTVHEEVLREALKQGDARAFEVLYELYQRELVAHLLRLLKSDDLAKEVAQDTFMALWLHRERLDSGKPLKPYLYKIATNLCVNVFKKAAHDQKYRAYLYPIIESGYEHIEKQILQRERQDLLDDLLQKMPEKQREVFIRCKVEGKRYEIVAAELGIAPATVHTHMKRANQFIKDYLARHPQTLLLILSSAVLLESAVL